MTQPVVAIGVLWGEFVPAFAMCAGRFGWRIQFRGQAAFAGGFRDTCQAVALALGDEQIVAAVRMAVGAVGLDSVQVSLVFEAAFVDGVVDIVQLRAKE